MEPQQRHPNLITLVALLAACFLLFLALPVAGQDITQGHIFVNGETVTAASMNAIAGGATINSAFYTAKATESSVADSDTFLLYSSVLSGYRGITWANLALTNAELVNVLFGTSDFARRSNFLAGVDEVTRSNFLGNANSLTVSNFVLLQGALAGSNDLYSWSFKVLGTERTPTNDMAFLVWDPHSNALLQATSDGLFTNLANLSTVASNDQVELRQASSGILGRTSVTNVGFALFTNIAFGALVLPAGGGFAIVTNTAHGLPSWPQLAHFTLYCGIAEHGYSVGDEVDLSQFQTATNSPAFTFGVNATNFFIYQCSAPQVLDRSVGTFAAITPGRWAGKVYMTYWFQAPSF